MLSTALLLLLPAPQVQFVESAASHGLNAYEAAPGMSMGLAAADYDQDGDVDLFVPTGIGFPGRLYRNRGDGSFDEVALELGLDGLSNERGALWFDRDGDGDLDLLVGGDHFMDASAAAPASLRLYEQEDGTFTDVTASAGLYLDLTRGPSSHYGGAAAGDLTGDGYPDLWVAMWDGQATCLVNDGAGHFTEADVKTPALPYGHYWQPLLHDFDGDGLLDVFQASDFRPNELWIANGDGTFRDEAASAGVDTAFNEMGVALGDYDGDGDFDLYVTNIWSDTRHNVLFERQGPGLAFGEIARQAGVSAGGWGWGTTFLDSDRNGSLDLVATNSGVVPGWPAERSCYFHNRGGGGSSFVEAGERVGYDDFDEGAGLIAFDADRDGDLDLVQACMTGNLLFYENRTPVPHPERRYLVVQPRMQGPNRFALGAVVRVTAGGRTYARLITAGTSLASQEPAEACFGFPPATTVDVEIDWPDGTTTQHPGVTPGQVLTIVR